MAKVLTVLLSIGVFRLDKLVDFFYLNILRIKRELAEWFKATSLKLVKTNYFHGFKSHTLCKINLKQNNNLFLFFFVAIVS